MTARFEWDEAKNAGNIQKHGVSFEEAKTAFYDGNARLISDPDHSMAEDRFILLGLSSKPRLLVVAHAYRENADVVRIISARKATTNEARYYGGRYA